MSAALGGGAAGAFTFGALVAVDVALGAVAWAERARDPKESSEAVATVAVNNFVVKRFMNLSLQRNMSPAKRVLD